MMSVFIRSGYILYNPNVKLEQLDLPLIYDPMIAEANLWNLSQGRILSDSVLYHYLSLMLRDSPNGSLIRHHISWIMSLFPDFKHSARIPNPWTWDDLVVKVVNVGSVETASEACSRWISEADKVAYWTGGLEFTRGQYEAARFLIEREYRVLLGVEPFCYPGEFNKDRGPIVGHIVPVSFWSKILGKSGFIFQVPRPLPVNEAELDDFYRELYQAITHGSAEIIVAEADTYSGTKRRRGPIVEVPRFNFPSTTDLWNSYFI